MTRRTLVFSALLPRFARASATVESVRAITGPAWQYPAWATLARLRNGELLVSYSGGRERHVCPFGRVELMRSSDDGKTWSYPQVLMDTAIDDRDSGVLETPKGSLLVTTFTSLAYEKSLEEARDWNPERLERWQSVQRATTPEQRKALVDCWMLRSTDGGMTWSAPYRVGCNSPHGPIALKDGRLLYPGKELWSDTHRIGVWVSKDDGRTWPLLAPIPRRPGDDVVQYHELHGVEAANGTLIVHIRNHNKENERETLQTESTNGGKTWSAPHPIGVWGLPSHLLRLKDGRLVMTYGYRRPPRGNHARVSTDQGKTWSEPVVLSDGGMGDLGYPSTVELDSGALLTLWYEAVKHPLDDRPYSVLKLARWRL